MTVQQPRAIQWKTILVAAIVVTLIGLAAVVASADDRSDRLDRKIRVMEGVFDKVLIESPNIMVSPGSDTTRGMALEGYGAVFMIQGRLNTRGVSGGEWNVFFPDDLEWVEAGELRALEFKSQQDQEEAKKKQEAIRKEIEERRKVAEQRRQEIETSRQETAAKREELKNALADELKDALMDFGATLVELPDDTRVAIAVFLDNSMVRFGGASDDDERFVISARMSDLRRYAGGDLNRETMAAKLTLTER